MAAEETPSLQWGTLSREGFQAYVGTASGPNGLTVRPVDGFFDDKATYFEYSRDGSKIAIKKPNGVDIRHADTGAVLQTFNIPNVAEVHISPQGSYLLTFVPLKEDTPDGNLVVWDIKTGEAIGKFLQKVVQEDSWPCVRWTEDETLAGRRVTNELHFWTGGNVGGHPIQKIRVENVADFSISPSKGVYFVAAFVAEKKGSPAEVRLYKYPNARHVCSKTFYADAAEFIWSPNGKHLLVSVSTHVDRTGRSYYGQSGLYYLSEKADCMVDTTTKKDGPVHSCCWRPDGLHFVAVYGFMPPKISAFNLKCDAALEYGVSHKSRVKFSPDGRILLIAGLGGGLKGDLEFWNPTELKKYGAAEASSSAVYCEWAPDSAHVMTAILSPRMRVDNNFQLWDYHGNVIFKKEFTELTHIAFRPIVSKLFPAFPLKYAPKPSPAAVAQPGAKPAGAYRHPNYRGGEPSIVRETKSVDNKPKKYQPPGMTAGSGIPGDTGPPPGKGANKKKKKPTTAQQPPQHS